MRYELSECLVNCNRGRRCWRIADMTPAEGRYAYFTRFVLSNHVDTPAARMGVDVLHRDLLLAFAAVTIERFEQRGVGAGELVRLGRVLGEAPDMAGLMLARRD